MSVPKVKFDPKKKNLGQYLDGKMKKEEPKKGK